MTTPQNQSSQPPPINGRFVLEPMPEDSSLAAIIEALLKDPGRLVHELQNRRRALLATLLLLFALFGMVTYGVAVGSFSGGPQMWIAPVKIGLGTLLSTLICLPSLYIFACLGGIDARLRTIAGTLFAAMGLTALLLIGFAPVAWIFSQSTDSVAFMSALHIGLWAIGIAFGLRLIVAMGRMLGDSAGSHLKLWGFIFVIVCLQMMTTLRPILGTSNRFLPSEKKFFPTHWFETVTGKNQEDRKIGTPD